jgi:lipid A 4'-phosphatase
MQTASPPPASPTAPSWQVPLAVLVTLAAGSTLVFWVSDLDIKVSALFYAGSGAMDPWPHELDPLWRFFYYGAPLFTALLAVGALAVLAAGLLHRGLIRWRRPAAYMLLTLAVGPGLLVNLVLKDHWGRPRPRQIEQFDGTLGYLPPLALGTSTDNKSFPAGHASVGFSLCVLWFLWRRRRPLLAWGGLGASILLGLLMGLGRLAAGAHFLSDVLWAGFITFFTALVLYHFVLRLPAHEGRVGALRPGWETTSAWTMLYALVGVAVLVGSLLGFPVERDVEYRLGPDLLPLPSHLVLDLRQGNVTIHLGGPRSGPLRVSGRVRGFGLPGYKIDSRAQREGGDRLVYRFKQRGFFTELDTRLRVDLDASRVRQLEVRLREGDIRVLADPGIPLPRLDLHTERGRVLPLAPYPDLSGQRLMPAHCDDSGGPVVPPAIAVAIESPRMPEPRRGVPWLGRGCCAEGASGAARWPRAGVGAPPYESLEAVPA